MRRPIHGKQRGLPPQPQTEGGYAPAGAPTNALALALPHMLGAPYYSKCASLALNLSYSARRHARRADGATPARRPQPVARPHGTAVPPCEIGHSQCQAVANAVTRCSRRCLRRRPSANLDFFLGPLTTWCLVSRCISVVSAEARCRALRADRNIGTMRSLALVKNVRFSYLHDKQFPSVSYFLEA
jgi:hypothetical protein